MCVIIAGTTKKPSLEVLEACEKVNGHGTGLAWVTRNGDVNYAKGLKPDAMHKVLESLTDGRPWAAHFRLATVGGQVPELSHPFPVLDGVPLAKDGRAPKVLFHNGHWSSWMEHGLKEVLRWGIPPLKGDISDSRVAALLVNHYGEDVLSLIPGKYVVLDKDGYRIWPHNRSEWHEIDGCWYSNKNWSYRCGAPSYTQSYCGYGSRTSGDYEEIRGGQEVYDQKQKWIDRFKAAGYTEENGVLIGPKAKATETEAAADAEIKLAAKVCAEDSTMTELEGRKEMELAGYQKDKDGWWVKRMPNRSYYRIWPRWNGTPPEERRSAQLPPHVEGI